MSDNLKFLLILGALIALMACAGSLMAQYTRTETTAPYVARTANPVAAEPALDGYSYYSSNALLVPLPWSFSYFDQAYRTCWMTSAGRVTFNGTGALETSTPGTLNPPVSSSNRNCVFGLGAGLAGRDDDVRRSLAAFVESDRVVLQWSNVASGTTQRCEYLNFQVHLLQNGNIELRYGPETSVPGYSEDFPFVSGLVNHTGMSSVAGFGNTLSLQTARPANGTLVSLALTQASANGVSINQSAMPARIWLTPPQTHVAVLAFKLNAVGTGGTVTSLQFSHPDFATGGDSVSFSLIQDSPPLGVHNGEALLGSPVTSFGNTTVSALAVNLSTGQSEDYLLLASFTSLASRYHGNYACYDGAGINSAGSAMARTVNFAPLGYAWMVASQPGTRPHAAAGSTHQRAISFSIVQDPDSPAFALTQMTFAMMLSAMAPGDILQFQLWRDAGVIGEWDANDINLANVTPLTAIVTFSGFSENTTPGGTPYLVTVDINPAFIGAGGLRLTWLTPMAGVPAPYGGAFGDSLYCTGTGATLVIRNEPGLLLLEHSVFPGETDVFAMVFSLLASAGSGDISSLFFADAYANCRLNNARLFIDNGAVSGRFDAGDTAVPATSSQSISGVTVTTTATLNIGTTPTRFVLVADVAATASGDMRLDLNTSGVTSTFTDVNGAANGAYLRLRPGSANGVDLQVQMLGSSFDVYTDSRVPVARAICTARGSGGAAPDLMLFGLDSPAGCGPGSAVWFYVYIEGAGPLGVLDAGDVECYRLNSPFYGAIGLQLGAAAMVPAGTTRSFLIVAQYVRLPGAPDLRGTFRSVFAGFQQGTDVAWQGGGAPPVFAPFTIDNKGVPTPQPPGGKDGDGGCTTGQTRGFGLMLAALMVLWLGRRRRVCA